MRLFLEGSAYDVSDCDFIIKLEAALKKGKFETKTEHHRDGRVKIQYRKELHYIEDEGIIHILEGFNETPPEVWTKKYIDNTNKIIEETQKRLGVTNG